MSNDTPAAKKRKIPRSILLGFPPLLLLAGAFFVYATGGRYITTENAYVKAEIISVSTNIDGQVSEVLASDNQRVEKGDPLFRIDARPFEMALAAADAELQSVRQKIASLRAHFRQGRMEVEAAEERIRYLEGQHKRQDSLLAKGVGTQAGFDKTEHELALARRQLRVVQETNQMVLADLGGAEDLPVEKHPLYLRADADRRRAELNLSYTVVKAPDAGTLSKVNLEAGEYIEAGDALFALVTIDEPWIEANFKESQMTLLVPGQQATVVVDTYPNVTWKATVESISPATGAEFSILPPQNATGNWVKVVQRIPVRLKIETQQHVHLLRAGMTATVSIDSGHERSAATFIKGVFARAPAQQ